VHPVDGLHVIESRVDDRVAEAPLPDVEPSDRPAPVVVLVHGSLDRAQSFRRVMRRLSEMHVFAYDRRGYAGSRAALDEKGIDLNGHVDDLVALVRALVDEAPAGAPVTLVGHSYGGDVVIGAELRAPELLTSLGAYEPPMPWLGFRRGTTGARGGPRAWPAMAPDAEDEAEAFFRRMVGDAAWDHLSEESRDSRRADGPALVADLLSLRGSKPFDPTMLRVPAVFGRGGPTSAEHHRYGTAWLADHVPGASLFEISGAAHGAHLSHPDGFATFVRSAVEAGRQATSPPATGEEATGKEATGEERVATQ
jgi:pimeloyl-ACP methyl ester carboxylesterase